MQHIKFPSPGSNFKPMIVSALFFILSNLPTQTVTACIDPPDSTYATVNFDTTTGWFCLQFWNMNMMGGHDGEFCTCALDEFSGAVYISNVVFYEEASFNPIIGFTQWNGVYGADTSWQNNVGGFSNWTGFVSNVTSSGILGGQKATLVVYGWMDTTYWAYTDTFQNSAADTNAIDTVFQSMMLGTDMWDDQLGTIANHHQGVMSANFNRPVEITYVNNLVIDTTVLSRNYPTTVNDIYTLPDNAPLTNIDVLANDNDPENDINSSSLSIVTGPANGSATIGSSGGIDYTPDTDFWGNDTIVYEICDQSQPAPLCSQGSLYITVDRTSSIGALENDDYNNLLVYPNPANDVVFIQLSSDDEKLVTIRIFDQDGRFVLARDDAANEAIILNTQYLSNGVYFYEIIADGELPKSGKLLINK